ncbi:hypothetical protein ETB97_006920 [Aspergillus alliaceus]|uniref:Uncharacterized protein n=1 Tax=Petromyces alliaceus TaxID=209559 RepID=A0A8H6EBV6_PETAA|nr:hypothetical protein ETB97_006920 [Aspergillus burnettii]
MSMPRWSTPPYDWMLDLLRFLVQVVFVEPMLESYGEELDIARAFSSQKLMAKEKHATGIAHRDEHGQPERVRQLVRDASQDSLHGAVLSVPKVVIVARRPGGTGYENGI